MDHKKRLDIPELKVLEDGKVWTYTLHYADSGIPYYKCPDGKWKQPRNNGASDECILLPITPAEFLSDHENYFYGYRIFIMSPGFEDAPADDDDEGPMKKLEIGFDVSRIRFFMEANSDYDIVIDFVGDSLFPTAIWGIKSEEYNMPGYIDTLIKKVIDSYCQFYIDRKI